MSTQRVVSVYLVDQVQKLNKTHKLLIWHAVDLVAFVTASVLSYLFFLSLIYLPAIYGFVYTLLAFVIYAALSSLLNSSTKINRYSGVFDYSVLFIISLISGAISGAFSLAVFDTFSYRFTVLAMIGTALMIISTRLLWQTIYLSKYKTRTKVEEIKHVILIGAGDGGSIFMNSYRRNPNKVKVVAILDDDPYKKGLNIGGVKVLGGLDLLPQVIEEFDVHEAIVAIPSLDPASYEQILQLCNQHKVDVFKMPRVEDVLIGNYRVNTSKQKVNISDLLGRKEIHLDETRLRNEIEGKTILITGAGGSIGSEISRQVSKFNPKKIVLLGHGENSIYLIYHELLKQSSMVNYVPVIADVQDYDRILSVFNEEKPDIIYHAAAHKHVPLMESNPVEAFKNNILGTYNVAKAVHQAGVGKMVLVSTDKAVRPPNVMGATKRVAELIVTGMNQISDSVFCAVRFGNVLGSRGSVIPVFEKQIAEGGPVTVTDFRMTRYFMTIPEASRLVIYAGAYAHNGEVFILDMGEPVKIVDLAKKMILLSGHTENEIEIKESGIRPGEKLYEELLTSSELVDNQLDDKIFVGKVATMALNEIEVFIDELHQYDEDSRKLKEKIISFANQSAN